MGTSTFERSIAWRRAQDLLELMETRFGDSKRFWFRDQLLRATLSISNNIAEGHGRPTRADRTRYLVIAKGSRNEVRSMLHYARRMKYMDDPDTERAIGLCQEIGRLLHAYMDPVSKRFGQLPDFAGLLVVAAWLEALFTPV
ncbi:MAG TPA: four helix bundle protein [Flavobacteriales bacterium]|nr:four helix bundle protein [Flavobacteriales bacterium]